MEGFLVVLSIRHPPFMYDIIIIVNEYTKG
ncbi:hypothetical protein M036_00855 [Bacillus subtilis TO-A]|jgi:hypothetical protein|nr:hypothetical protein M036_00855 [Bacillus subtilis TO-A]EXF51589.1 hypothetical protein Y647_20230 [Bacillus subtilis QH-1]